MRGQRPPLPRPLVPGPLALGIQLVYNRMCRCPVPVGTPRVRPSVPLAALGAPSLVDFLPCPPRPFATFARHPSSSKMRPLLPPRPLGEGWGEGLPRNHAGVKRRVPLAESRPFPPQLGTLPAGLPACLQPADARPVQSAPQSRNPVSPRRPSPPRRAAPAGSVAVRARSFKSPQFRKKFAQTVSGQPAPSGGRLARDSSPLHPPPTPAPPPSRRRSCPSPGGEAEPVQSSPRGSGVLGRSP